MGSWPRAHHPLTLDSKRDQPPLVGNSSSESAPKAGPQISGMNISSALRCVGESWWRAYRSTIGNSAVNTLRSGTAGWSGAEGRCPWGPLFGARRAGRQSRLESEIFNAPPARLRGPRSEKRAGARNGRPPTLAPPLPASCLSAPGRLAPLRAPRGHEGRAHLPWHRGRGAPAFEPSRLLRAPDGDLMSRKRGQRRQPTTRISGNSTPRPRGRAGGGSRASPLILQLAWQGMEGIGCLHTGAAGYFSRADRLERARSARVCPGQRSALFRPANLDCGPGSPSSAHTQRAGAAQAGGS